MTETKVLSLNFKELLTSSLAMYKANFKLLILLSLVSFIASVLVTVYNYSFLAKLPQIINFFINLITILISIWIIISITRVVVNKNSNQPISFIEAFSYSRKKFWRVIGVLIGCLLILFLPMLFFLLILRQMAVSLAMSQALGSITSQLEPAGFSNGPGIAFYTPMIVTGLIGVLVIILLGVLLYFAQTSAIIEGKETNSFSNGWGLLSKRFWRVLWFLLVFTAIVYLIPIAIGVIEQIFKGKLGATAGLGLELAIDIYNLFILPLNVIFTTLFYFKLKQLKAADLSQEAVV